MGQPGSPYKAKHPVNHRSVSVLGLAALHGQYRTEGRMNDEKKEEGYITEE